MSCAKSLTPAVVLAVATTSCYEAVPGQTGEFERARGEGLATLTEPAVQAARIDAELIE